MFKFLSRFGRDVGIDLGTSNTEIYLANRGIVVNEATLAAINNKTGQLVSFGNEAKKMIGRTPIHIDIVRPIVNGVISDFEATEAILKNFLKLAGEKDRFLQFRRAVVAIPANLTEVERKSVEDVVISAGVSRAYLIDQALAAALGARLPIHEPTANMIVDIGAGTTEIAIISMGGKVISKSLKIAGEKLNEDVIRFIRDEFRLIIGEPTAEDLKIQIGSAMPLTDKLEMVIQGRDNSNGLPKEVTVRDIHVRTAISKSLRTIVENIRSVIESAPPELSGDILKNGVFICGGTSMLRLLSEMISRELSVAVHLVDDPKTCVVRGTGVAVERFEEFKEVLTYPYAPRDIKV